MLAWIMFIIMCIISIVLVIKILIMHSDLKKICFDLSERISSDTNNLIYVSTKDKYIRKLAVEINYHLKELRFQRQKFQSGNMEINDALISVSHDLRTPLTAICGYLELMEQEEKTETVKQYLRQIENRTDALKQLTEELFRYSVIPSIKYINKEELSLNKLLEDNLISYYGVFQTKNIKPIINMSKNAIIIKTDKTIVNRIIDNILSNVVKYSKGDLILEMNDLGVITFSNKAIGLSQMDVAKLFDRFYTVETKRNSTGLGLSIAKLLIEKIDGIIDAEYNKEILSIKLYLNKKWKG